MSVGKRGKVEPTSKRRIPVVIALTAVALVMTMVGVIFMHEKQASATRVGFLPEESEHHFAVEEVSPGSPAAAAGLEPGDVFVAVNGRPVATESDYDAAASEFRRGKVQTFTVQRDETEVSLSVRSGTPIRWRPAATDLLLALCYLAVGILAFLQNPEDLRARLLFAFTVAVAVEMGLVLDVAFGGMYYIVRFTVYYFVTGVQMALELHLASVIPERAEWLRRRPWLVPVYYVIGLGIGVVTSVGFVTEIFERQLLPWSFASVESVVFGVGTLLWALAVVTILYSQIRVAGDPQHRNQAVFVLLGVMPWAVYTVVWEALVTFGVTPPGWLEGIESAALLVYPVAVFIAIFRYSLFDIELVLRRSLVYTALTTSLVLVFYAALGAGGALFSELLEGGVQSIWVISGATLLLGLLFSPLRRWLQSEIDRRVFPERLAQRQRLADLAGHLPARGSLPSMGQHLVDELTKIFALSSATLLVADPKSGVLVSLASNAVDLRERFDQSFLLQPDDPGLAMLRRIGRPLRTDQVRSHSAALAQRMRAFHAELVIALQSGAALIGLLLLGPNQSGERYASEELELLSLFSHNVASVLENARLFESATYEGLTGLLRREAVLSELERELHRARRYGRPMAIGMADIDRFKSVNDRHGHLAGDALLKRVAQALASGLRTSDIIGRYGGEEFLFILPETDLEGAVQVAEKLRHRVEAMEAPADGLTPGSLTISIGLAAIPSSISEPSTADPSPTALIAEADQRLLEAKRSGRNRVVPGSSEAA